MLTLWGTFCQRKERALMNTLTLTLWGTYVCRTWTRPEERQRNTYGSRWLGQRKERTLSNTLMLTLWSTLGQWKERAMVNTLMLTLWCTLGQRKERTMINTLMITLWCTLGQRKERALMNTILLTLWCLGVRRVRTRPEVGQGLSRAVRLLRAELQLQDRNLSLWPRQAGTSLWSGWVS